MLADILKFYLRKVMKYRDRATYPPGTVGQL